MKNILLFLLLGFVPLLQAQNKIKFSYDSLNGNQLTRELCLNCQSGKPARDIKEIEAVTDEDLLKFSPEDVISYYPNPVREELYLKWELKDETFVKAIQVIGVNGQVLRVYGNTKNTSTQNIPFQNLPTGVYIVSLSYNNGEQKTIKIIKQ